MIKLIATDMDGTFLDEQGKLPENALEIIKEVIDQGIIFTVASGRQCQTLERDFEEVKDKIAIIAENGAYVKYGKEALMLKKFPLEIAREIVKDVRKIVGADPVLCCKKAAYIERETPVLREEANKYYYSNALVEDLTQVEGHVLKIAVYHPTEIEKVWKQLSEKWGEAFNLVISGKVWVDVCIKDADKGIAISALQNHFGITKEETMAFGDYFNDLGMLKNAGHSYVMENAPEDLKKHAKFVAKTNGVLDIIAEKVL